MKANVTTAWMPPTAPQPMPVQALDKPYRDTAVPQAPSSAQTFVWRIATFLPAVLATLGLVSLFVRWLAADGYSVMELVVVTLVASTFFWIALSVSTAVSGAVTLLFGRSEAIPQVVAPLDVALLVPIHNENAADVFGNVAAMLADIRKQRSEHSFDLYILSDTRDDAIAWQEERAFVALLGQIDSKQNVFYRRRKVNTDRKVGNLSDWVENYSGHYTAMLVLDADSLMSAESITKLTNALSADTSAGLVQSFPALFGANTLFGRVQQFSNRVYGAALARGLAKWTDREGNYWGHNAIMRVEAFAQCAGLPKVNGKLILSHDFVEAGLLRRAGWSVSFVPEVEGSYEEVPATLIDYFLRDRRWCQGNLQHLRLLRTRGLHVISRFHLLSGAMGYLVSPAWFALLMMWALVVNGQEMSAVAYFSGYDPQVSWPDISTGNTVLIMVIIYGMLLAPKLIGVLSARLVGISVRDMGGPMQFTASFVLEILLSVLYAPIMMVQQSVAVFRTLAGFNEQWVPQQRRGGSYSLSEIFKFHLLETITGGLLLALMLKGLVSWWLLPIAVSLLGATALSALGSMDLSVRPRLSRQLSTPENLNAPAIIKTAFIERERFADLLAEPGHTPFNIDQFLSQLPVIQFSDKFETDKQFVEDLKNENPSVSV